MFQDKRCSGVRTLGTSRAAGTAKFGVMECRMCQSRASTHKTKVSSRVFSYLVLGGLFVLIRNAGCSPNSSRLHAQLSALHPPSQADLDDTKLAIERSKPKRAISRTTEAPVYEFQWRNGSGNEQSTVGTVSPCSALPSS